MRSLAGDWTHLASDAARTSTTCASPVSVRATAWIAPPQPDETFVARAAPVVYGSRVFVVARYFENQIQAGNRLIAFDAGSGERLWATPLQADSFGSFSSPAVDVNNCTVLVAAGNRLYSLAVSDGAIQWETELPRVVVNASPLVTSDLRSAGVPHNRALISDFDGGAGDAELHAINVDPFDALLNPFQPGEIVWSLPMNGSSGNTPAYAQGVAYVADVSGLVRAVSAAGGGVLWSRQFDFPPDPNTNQIVEGFFGGLTAQAGAVFLAAYAFDLTFGYGMLCKLDAASGSVLWTIPCERTVSIPLVVGQRRVLVAGGVDYNGYPQTLQAFLDQGDHATLLWDTHADTNGELVLGGWTHQPAAGRAGVYVGSLEPGAPFFGAYDALMLIDPLRFPNDPLFVKSISGDAGGSPAIRENELWSIGAQGLVAIRAPITCSGDLNGDGDVGQPDLAELLSKYGTSLGDAGYSALADVNCDGMIDQGDLAALLSEYGSGCGV